VCGCPGDLLDAENFGKLFLSFFVTVSLPGIQISEAGIQAGWKVATRYRYASKVTMSLLFPCPHYGVEIKSSAYIPRASRLKSRRARAIFFRERL
jgi:hypothetical protein